MLIAFKKAMDGKDIKRWRESQGLQSKDLAKLLGVHPVTVSRSERRGPGRLLAVLIGQLMEKVASGTISLTSYISEVRSKPRKKLGRPRRRGRPRIYPKGSKRRGKPGRPRKPGRPKGSRSPQKNAT